MSTYTRPYSEVNDQVGQASSINRYIDDFASTVNNLGSGNLALSGVTTSALNNNSVTDDKIDHEVHYHMEVFS
jgi:hypothetical protein